MAAEDSLLFISYNSCEWHLLKSLIDLGKDTVWIIDILTKSLCALISKAEIFIDVFILVISSQEHDLFWIFQLESEKEADDLKTVLSFVHVISEEQVVKSVDVSCVEWSLPDVEESHQVGVLTIDVSDDFHWGSNLLNDDWLSCEDLGTLIGKLDDVLSLAWELNSWLDILTFLWLEERLQEHLAKRVIWVLVNLCMILLLRVQLLWLLSELVYRNLSHDKRKVLCSGVIHLGVLDL